MSPETKLKFLPWIVGLGLFIENIDVTVINTSLSEISKSIYAEPLDLKIAITSYLLMLAVLIPISGYIADKIGTKKTFSCAIIIFMIGSLICGTSTSLLNLIIGRLIRGIGGAVMAPVGRLILVKIFPRSKFVQAFSYVVIVGQLGTAIGGVPFLLPLLFQLDFRLSILASSLLLLPYGIGFLCAKFVLKKALNYFGFKKFLILNTLCLSIILFVFASITASSNLLFLNILIFILGGLVSLQFSSMSIMNYVDVEADRLSKATSLSSVVQQLSLGLGVCLVASLLTFFDPIAQEDNFIALVAFQDTFYILSGLVILALFVFARLDAEDGSQVLESDKTVAKA